MYVVSVSDKMKGSSQQHTFKVSVFFALAINVNCCSLLFQVVSSDGEQGKLSITDCL